MARYLSEVFCRARNDTANYFRKDNKAWVYELFSPTILIIITAFGGLVLGKIPQGSFVFPFLTALVTAASLLIIWGLLTFVYYLLTAPANIFYEQQDLISSFRSETLKLRIKHYGFSSKVNEKNFERFVFCEISNDHLEKITDLDVKISNLDVYKVSNENDELWASVKISSLGSALWENGETKINLAPEDEARMFIARTNTEKNGFNFNSSAVGKGAFQYESIFGIKLRFKGKVEGEKKYRFLNHEIFIYGNNSLSRDDYRLNFLELLKGENIGLHQKYWGLLEQIEQKAESF